MGETIHVTDAAFEKAVLQNPLPVVVDFWAPWCGPCKVVDPMLTKISQELGDKLVVAKVNTDENPQWASQYGIQGIPTMLFIFGGKIIYRQTGALPEKMLREAVMQFIDVTSHPKV
jgi:thioredoxin 1